MSIAKIVKLGKKGQIVIPKALRESIGVKEGDMLLITAESNQLHLVPPDKYVQMTRGILKGLWGNNDDEIKAYLEEERNSWE
jgi:AbrB family looped-hinge helix DNA binding protein